MKMEVSINGIKWTPVADINELEGFIQGIDTMLGNWKIQIRKAI